MRHHHIPLLLFGLLALTACGAGGEGAQTPTLSDEQIQTAMHDISLWRTQTAEAIPSATPTITLTPTETPVPSPTIRPTTVQEVTQTAVAYATAVLTEPKTDGIFIVGADMLTGDWRLIPGEEENCFWVRRKAGGLIFAIYYGPPVETTLRVYPYDYEVELEGCGRWEFVGP